MGKRKTLPHHGARHGTIDMVDASDEDGSSLSLNSGRAVASSQHLSSSWRRPLGLAMIYLECPPYRFPNSPWADGTAHGTAFWHGPWAARHGCHRARAGTSRRSVSCMCRRLGPRHNTGTHGLRGVARRRHGPAPNGYFGPAGQLADRGPRPYKSQPRRPPPQSLTLIIPPPRSRSSHSHLSALDPIRRGGAAVRLKLAGPAPVTSTPPRRPLLLPLLPPLLSSPPPPVHHVSR
jgi:hypothetical protein